MKNIHHRLPRAIRAWKSSLCASVFIVGLLLTGLLLPPLLAQSFTIQQALSAPFPEYLTAAPAGRRIAWVANGKGQRNLWLAEPAANGSGFTSRQLTHYSQDDGQVLSSIEWTPDAKDIIYVRGGDAQGPTHPVPNPAWFPLGAKQQIWEVDVDGGEPRLIAEGRAPAIAPNGKMLAFLERGQIWMVSLDTPNAKPQQILEMRGSSSDLHWSPDSSRLAFVSFRRDHSFIVVYSIAEKRLNYLDPSTDYDSDFVWSPDSKSIVFVRRPSIESTIPFAAHRTGYPWSIRAANVVTGQGRQVWRAAEGEGSVFWGTSSPEQLHWVAGNRLIFPWERDGWLHFYSVPASGGTATPLTPGKFEVDHVSLSFDRKTLVFDSNQDDIGRKHVWMLKFADDGAAGPPQRLTFGTGIEAMPVVLSDNATVAILHSNARFPMQPAIIQGSRIVDLAPQAMPKDFPGAQFVVPQQVIFPATDGLQIHGQLFVPSGLKKGERRPAVVFFHGGSRHQMLLGFPYIKYYSDAYAFDQYLVSKGFIVLSVNYRGGTGYGLDFREALNYGPSGASEFNDVLGAGLYLRSRSDVEGNHIGCWGGSYGGYLTALALARASYLYKAGADLSGVTNWNDFAFPGSLWDYHPLAHPRIARRAFLSSPIASISSWRSPVLLIQGDDDRNVPFEETVKLVIALRKQGVDVEQMVLPDEVHQILLRSNWLRAYPAIADFLEQKLMSK